MIDRKKIRDEAFLKEYKGTCPACGYKLEKPASEKCPECGSRLQVMLLAPFRFTPWHALLTGVAISVGVIFDRVFLTLYGVFQSRGSVIGWNMFLSSLVPLVLLLVFFYVIWKLKSKFEQIILWKRVFWYIVALLTPIIFSVGQFFILIYLVLRV